MSIAIRRAGTGDEHRWRRAVEQVIAAEDRNGALLTHADARAALRDDRCYLLLAESGERVIGLLTACRFPDLTAGGSLVYLYDIEVLEPLRCQGAGRALLGELLRLCAIDGVSLVWAGTEAGNTAARSAFEGTGAELAGERYVEYEWRLENCGAALEQPRPARPG